MVLENKRDYRQHMFYIHPYDDANVLSANMIQRNIINSLPKYCSLSLTSYRHSRDKMGKHRVNIEHEIDDDNYYESKTPEWEMAHLKDDNY